MATQYIWDMVRTWNSGVTKFFGIKMDVTDTASDADSRLLEMQVGSTMRFSVRKDGSVYAAADVNATGNLNGVDVNTTGRSLTAVGSAAAPAYSFTGDPDTGVFRSAANALGLVAGGVESTRIVNTGIRMMLSGSASSPPYHFQSEGNTGFFLNGSNNPAFSVAGSMVLNMVSNSVRIGTTESSPGIANVQTGIALSTSGRVSSSCDDGPAATMTRNGSNGSVMSFYRSGVFTGSISVTLTDTTYGTASDYRLKEEVEAPASYSATDIVKRMAAALRWFHFTATPERNQMGWFAHELQEIQPLAVIGEKDAVNEDGSMAVQQVDYGKTLPDVMLALAQTIERLEAAEEEIAALKARLDA